MAAVDADEIGLWGFRAVAILRCHRFPLVRTRKLPLSAKAKIKRQIIAEKFWGTLVYPKWECGILFTCRKEHLCQCNNNLLAEH